MTNDKKGGIDRNIWAATVSRGRILGCRRKKRRWKGDNGGKAGRQGRSRKMGPTEGKENKNPQCRIKRNRLN